jgi:nucleoside-diphosphate-sugar epimerase
LQLFAFGLGYSTLHFIDSYAGDFTKISGTVRSVEKIALLAGKPIEALLFNAEETDPAVAARIADADVLLVSVPPGPVPPGFAPSGASGDPALEKFGDLIAASRARRIVYLSTLGVYGDHGGGWIDETAATVPVGGRQRRRLEAEAAWRAIAGHRTSVLRLAGIYGPGRNALVNLRAGKAHRIVKQGQVFNRTHVTDIAQAIAAAIAHQAIGIWNVCDDAPAPPQDVVSFAAELMGIAPPPEQDFAEAEMSEMARSFYASSNRVSNARLKRELGVALAFPTYRDGLTALWQAGEGKGIAASDGLSACETHQLHVRH